MSDTDRDYASKAWLKPADEPLPYPVRLMDLAALVCAAVFGVLFAIGVLNLIAR